MKPSISALLAIYRRNLSKYIEEGRHDQAEVQQKLIERLEAEERAEKQRG